MAKSLTLRNKGWMMLKPMEKLKNMTRNILVCQEDVGFYSDVWWNNMLISELDDCVIFAQIQTSYCPYF